MSAQRKQYHKAIDYTRQSLDIYQAIGHHHAQGWALNNIGWFHTLLGDHVQALTNCQEALTIQLQLNDRPGLVRTWDSLGYAHHQLGHHTQAITCYQHATDLAQDLDDRYIEAVVLAHLGDVHHTTGNRTAARQAWRHAVTILNDLQHHDANQLRAKLAGLDTPHLNVTKH